MRILIVGDGKVGHSIAEHLVKEKHDVVVIDHNEEVLKKCEDTCYAAHFHKGHTRLVKSIG